MRCERTHPLAMLCENCTKKWIVQPDSVDGWMEFFCFDTEAEARACYEQIERTNEYDGLRFKPKTAVLLAPKEERA